jgi:hypothetical protein
MYFTPYLTSEAAELTSEIPDSGFPRRGMSGKKIMFLVYVHVIICAVVLESTRQKILKIK